MQNVLFDLEGDLEDVVAIIIDAYALIAAPICFLVAPVGRDVFSYRYD